MTDHLSSQSLNALADGELAPDQLVLANEHLAGCPECTSRALYQSLLKAATSRAAQRYAPPSHLQGQLMSLALGEKSRLKESEPTRPVTSRAGWAGWTVAAALLLIIAGTVFVQRNGRGTNESGDAHAVLANEVFDLQMTTLAESLPPQVLSTDRHTVKPWFEGKIPFSFNLPETLPKDTTLYGASLTYLKKQPAAQLLYTIGRHRVSVFLSEKPLASEAKELPTEQSGFHIVDRSTDALEIIAVSDVDPARLAELVSSIRQAQTENYNPSVK